MKKIKKMLASLMVAVMVLTAAPLSGFVGMELNLDWINFDWLDFNMKASAATYSGSCGKNLTWSFDTSTGELVISGEGDMVKFESSSQAPWHDYRSAIISVEITGGVTSVGQYSFIDCTSLTQVRIGEDVTMIDNWSFYNCSALNELIIPISTKIYNSENTFYSCTNIKKVTFTEGNNNPVNYSNSTSSDDTYFKYTPWYISQCSEIVISDGIKTIGKYTFYQCAQLKILSMPISTIFCRDGDSSVFSGCNNIESIFLTKGTGKGVDYSTSTAVGINFINCYYAYTPWYISQCSNVVIEDGVNYIGEYTFYKCSSLTNITIPDSVTRIGEYAFAYSAAYNNAGGTDVVYVGKHLIKANKNISGNYSIKSGTKSIADYAFQECTQLTGIIIPDGLLGIGAFAFDACTSLVNIDFGTGLKEIGRYAFSECKIESMIVPNTVESIGGYAFNECSYLKSIILPDGISTIQNGLFRCCTMLTNLTVPDSVTSIGDYAFYSSNLNELSIPVSLEFSSLALSNGPTIDRIILTKGNGDGYVEKPWSRFGCSEVVLGDGVELGPKALSGCASVKKVYINKGLVNIASSAFYNCYNITEFVVDADCENYSSDENGVLFSKDKRILVLYPFGKSSTSYAVPEGIAHINDYAFSFSKQLKNITIPNSVLSIGEYAFAYCTGLSNIVIPNSVISIGENAFLNCNFSSISVDDSNTMYSCDDYGVLFNKDKTELIKYPANNSKTSYSIPDSVKSVVEYAFAGTSGLKTVIIPDGVTSIGESLFEGATGIKTVEIRSSITSIPERTFYNCTELETVILKGDITTIGERAFCNCGKLQSFDIPETVTSIEKSAFSGCDSLTSIILPDSLISINDNVFYSCNNLNSVKIGNSVTTIGIYAFSQCDSLTSIILPNSVISINDYGFYHCDNLNSIEIGTNVTSIGQYAFSYCKSLEEITIPDNVTSLGAYAFEWCTGLTSITLSNRLVNIERNTFRETNLREIIIPDSVENIYDSAFSNCDNMQSVIFGKAVKNVSEAFYSCDTLKSITTPDTARFSSYDFRECPLLKTLIITKGIGSTESTCPPTCISIKDQCTNIIFKEGITHIASGAFKDFKALKYITIPSSVKQISSDAFNYSIKLKLTSIYYEGTLSEWCEISFVGSSNNLWSCVNNLYISGNLIENNLIIPAGVERIGPMAFSGLRKITSVTLPDGLTSLGYYAFSNCNAINSVTIPDSVQVIGENAFQNCTGITNTYYKGSQKQWNDIRIISGNDYLTKNIIFESASERPYYNSGSCGENLKWIIYSDGELVISGTGSMTDYSSESPAPWNTQKTLVKIVTIEKGVTTIGDYAFNGCSNLAKIMIPETVESIGDSASLACSALTDIYYSGTEVEWNGITIGSSNEYINNAEKHFEHTHNYKAVTVSQSNCLVTGKSRYECACGSISKYEETPLSGHTPGSWSITKSATTSAEGEKIKKCTVCSTVLEREAIPKLDPVCDYLKWKVSGGSIVITGFYSGLSGDVVLPESINGYDVTEIAAKAFLNNSKITSIQIPARVTSIGEAAFAYCRNLKSVTIPWGISSIDQAAFIGCTNLEEIKIYDDYYEEYTNDGLYFKTDDRGVLFSINRNSGNKIEVFYAPAKAVDEAYTIPDFATSAKNSAFADCKDFSLTLSDGFDMAYNSVFFQLLSANEFSASENCVKFSTADGVLYSKDGKTLVKYPVDSDRQLYVVPDTVTSLASNSVFYVMEEEQELIMKYNLSYSFDNIVKVPAHLTVHIPSDMSLDKFLIGPSHYCVAGYTQSEISAGNSLVSEEIAYWTEYWDEIRYEYSSSSVEYKMYNNYITCMKNAYGTFEVCEEDHTNPYPFCNVTGTVSPTCTKDGYDKYRCIECGYTFNVVVESTGHNHNAVVTEPTCTKQGYTTYTCACGDSYVDDYVDATGHGYTSEVTTPATHTTTGVTTYTCSCGDTYTETIDKIAEHKYESVVTAPTCEDKGYTTYTCECGESYVADYVDATGHSYTSEVTTPATHTATGVMTYTCSCGDTYTETIVKIERHNYNTVVTVPTCEDKGYTTYTCECGDSYVDDYVDATGHSYTVTVTAPTCENQGYTTFTCACGDSYVTDYVDAQGHTAGEWVITKPATSTQSGTKTQSCTVCGTVLNTQTIPAYGKVRGVSVSNVSLDYKSSTTLNPQISVDAGVKYTVTYSSSNPSVASVDANGKVSTGKTGSATITVTVTDEYGNTVSDTCNVEVKYNWWQWVLVIVLFGWIWY